ncbi:hypothetical protein L1049_019655 [Liquidambar formosana]|uniref:HAT C-terminal dimerisation domain-containing protein n=1 Tax=Liquidambar formosana TaxID=63359 RepID=A0AAP0SC07_LIQFO
MGIPDPDLKCTQYALNRDKKQSILGFRPVKTEPRVEGGEPLVACTFSVEAYKKAFVEMIIIDELPFNFAVKEGFRRFMHVAQPNLTLPSRTTVAKDCLNIYYNEKKILKHALREQRVCFTTDTWTSIQKLNYMCLTAHYINSDWKVHKKILNFCLAPNHKGDTLDIDDSIVKVRNAVRYVRSSPSRMAKFKNCAEKEAIEFKDQVCLDVPTRWNSTYLMLERALQFRKAFERLEEEDTFFLTKFREDDRDDDRDGRHLKKEDSMLSKSELERYLMDRCEVDGRKFDILGWWKHNSTKYRILSQVACDVLAVHVSTVASEYAFSTGRRVLDPFCSSLSHKIVEALICAQNWMRKSRDSISIRDALDEVEQYEKMETCISNLAFISNAFNL